MSQLTNDKNQNLEATLVPSSTARGPIRRRTFTGAVALGAVLTLALFAGRAEAGLSLSNGMRVHNGLRAHNGMKVHNGMSAHTGISAHNGMKVHNGMSAHTGISAHNGMKVHNGATVSGTWVMRTIDPARSLSAAVKARR